METDAPVIYGLEFQVCCALAPVYETVRHEIIGVRVLLDVRGIPEWRFPRTNSRPHRMHPVHKMLLQMLHNWYAVWVADVGGPIMY